MYGLNVMAFVIPVSLCVNHNFGGLGTVMGWSMRPTFNNDNDAWFSDRILLDRFSIHRNIYRRGDVVIFRYASRLRRRIARRARPSTHVPANGVLAARQRIRTAKS